MAAGRLCDRVIARDSSRISSFAADPGCANGKDSRVRLRTSSRTIGEDGSKPNLNPNPNTNANPKPKPNTKPNLKKET